MKNMMILFVFASLSDLALASELYRSVSGDSGKYYVLSSKKLADGNVKVLSSRVDKENAYTDFTELKVNCNEKKYFMLAGSDEDGEKNKPSKKLKDLSKHAQWMTLVDSSSKSDLVKFICNKY